MLEQAQCSVDGLKNFWRATDLQSVLEVWRTEFWCHSLKDDSSSDRCTTRVAALTAEAKAGRHRSASFPNRLPYVWAVWGGCPHQLIILGSTLTDPSPPRGGVFLSVFLNPTKLTTKMITPTIEVSLQECHPFSLKTMGLLEYLNKNFRIL